jgi:alkylation response protein AidB-like acyl-CoA dehydrogenase
MIDFELDESQLELQSAVRRMFADAGGLALARGIMEEGGGYSRDIWQAMSELDLPGMSVPEAYGGAGGGLLDHYAVALETGRALVTSPLIPSSVVAAHVLAAAASDSDRASELVGGIASGHDIVAPALLEPSGVWDEGGVEARLEASGDDLRLTGTKVLVPFADVASTLLVAVRGDDGVSLVLVDPAAAGIEVAAVENLAALPLFTVTLDNVALTAADVVGPRGGAWTLLGPAMDRGAVLRAAEIAGAGEQMLEMVVDYAQQREQFGKPIGVHQAVQYLCSDIAIESHLTGVLAKRAAWLLDTGQPADRAVAAANLYASRAAAHMCRQAHEVFAGLAFMMEHDLHLFTRHGKHWEHDLGDVRHHTELLVSALEREVV